MFDLHDTLILDSKARRLSTGELAASVRCARTGVQDYAGHEVGKPELERVTVYRPETEVMKRDSFATFAGVPVTIEHPRESVTTDNWKRYAVGESGDEVVRDGEFIRVPILVRDESAIRAIQDGKRQISMGYSCSLEFVDGLTPDGKPYQAIQSDIKVNHLAVVDQARGGRALVVEDQRTFGRDEQTYSPDANDANNRGDRSDANKSQAGAHDRRDGEDLMATKTITFDGVPLEATDAAEAVIRKLEGLLSKATADNAAAATKAGEDAVAIATKDGEIAALNQKVKDAEIGPDKLQQMVADRAALIEKAKSVDPKVVTDGKSDAEIRSAIVAAKLGDSAPTDENGIAGAFAALTKDVKAVDKVREAISAGAVNVGDTASIRDAARSNRYA